MCPDHYVSLLRKTIYLILITVLRNLYCYSHLNLTDEKKNRVREAQSHKHLDCRTGKHWTL